MSKAWVILHYFPYEPVQVYGMFATEAEARAYADAQGFAVGEGAYDVQTVLNIDELTRIDYRNRRQA